MLSSILLFLIFSLSIHAETKTSGSGRGVSEVGNGAHAIICSRPNRGQSVELLDFYEGKTLNRYKIDLGSPSLGVAQKLEIAAKRLERLSQTQAAGLRYEASRFFKIAAFVSNADLKGRDTLDISGTFVPRGCKIEQLIVQRQSYEITDRRYIVNQDLWKHLSRDHQAGAILHEIIYGANSLTASNSIATRNVTAALSSSWIDRARRSEVIAMMRANRILGDHHDSVAKEITFETDTQYAPFEVKIDFQPETPRREIHNPLPAEYLRDTGAEFGNRDNGFAYGWNAPNRTARDRRKTRDQRYDTVIDFKSDGQDLVWNLAVPNGSYEVTLVAGDPGYFDSHYQILAEGKVALEADPTSERRFFEATARVEVKDRSLTLSSGAASINNKIAFVHVRSLEPALQCPSPAEEAFTGCYFGSSDFTRLAMVRQDKKIDFDWDNRLPHASLRSETFSVSWAGTFFFKAAKYRFSPAAVGGFRLYVDRVLVVDRWNHVDFLRENHVQNMSAGKHELRMEYFRPDWGATAHLDWREASESSTETRPVSPPL
jgi:hypothetical protein